MGLWLLLARVENTKTSLWRPSGTMACSALVSTGIPMKYISLYISPRLRDPTIAVEASSKRYVITNPPYDFGLLPTDQVRLDCPWLLLSVGKRREPLHKLVQPLGIIAQQYVV